MGKRIKWTIEKVIEECREHDVECLEKEYVNSATKMRFECGCGNVFERDWNHVTSKGQWKCPKCSSKAKWTIEEIKRKCQDKKIECLEDKYVNNATKMRFECGCGNVYETTWNHVISNDQWQCPECGLKKGTIEKVIEECGKHDVVCLEKEYVNARTKMRFKCGCGNVYEAQWSNVISNDQWQCSECSGRIKWTIEEIKRKCQDKKIECLEDKYVNVMTKMRFECKCGNVYEARWNDVISNDQWQCPKCSSKTSRGEIITSEFLSNLLKDENSFEEQKTFEDLTDKGSLSYDFFIPEFNILIEIQGIQHYKPVEMFGGKKQFKKQQLHDKLKREYAEQNGFTLIEIPWGCNGIDTEEKLIEELKNKLSGLIK